MTGNDNTDGFTGNPAAAWTVAGSAGCCGNPAQATNITLPDPANPTSGTCCGTRRGATSSWSNAAAPAIT